MLSLVFVLLFLPVVTLPHAYAAVSVTVAPASLVVAEYSIGTYTVSLGTPTFPGESYALTLSGLPSGVDFAFGPNPVTVPLGGATSTLTIAGQLCSGSYTMAVTASHTGPTPGADSSSSNTFVMTVTPVGPPIQAVVSTDKPTYRIGDKVTILMSVNRPAFVRLTISPPSGSPSIFDFTIYGASATKSLTASQPIGRYTVTVEATSGCGDFSSAVAYFDISPDTYDVSVSLSGVPSQVSANLLVDGQNQGTMGGSEIKKVSFKVDTTHSLSVDQYVTGEAGTRYYCSQNTWNVGSTGSHTFEYETQYLFTVGTDPEGVAQVSGGGWFRTGSSVQTNEAPQTLTGPAGTQYVFKGWEVDGAPQPGNPITLTLDRPREAVAKYQTQYQLVVDSPGGLGDPKGSGYYDEDSNAEFSVTSPVGFLIQQVFVNWEGDYSGTSPQGSITMDKPKVVRAVWTTSYTQLYMVLGAAAAVVIIAALLLLRRRRAAAGPSLKPTPPMPEEPEVGGPPPAEAPPETSSSNIKCSSCGGDVPAGQAFCHHCGAKIG